MWKNDYIRQLFFALFVLHSFVYSSNESSTLPNFIIVDENNLLDKKSHRLLLQILYNKQNLNSSKDISKDLINLINDLYDIGYRVAINIHKEGEGLSIEVLVKEFNAPIHTLIWQGITDDEKKVLLKEVVSKAQFCTNGVNILPIKKIERLKQEIQAYYLNKGYKQIKIHIEKKTGSNALITIEKGKVHYLSRIRIHDTKHIPSALKRHFIKQKKMIFFPVYIKSRQSTQFSLSFFPLISQLYTPSNAENIAFDINSFFKKKGYNDVQVKYILSKYKKKGEVHCQLDFHIIRGGHHQIKKVKVTNYTPYSLSPETLKKITEIKNTSYSEDNIYRITERAKKLILDTYDLKPYQIIINPVWGPLATKTYQVQLEIFSQPLQYIGEIKWAGQNILQENILTYLLHKNNLEKGKPFDENNINRFINDLRSNGFIGQSDNLNIETIPSGLNTIDIAFFASDELGDMAKIMFGITGNVTDLDAYIQFSMENLSISEFFKKKRPKGGGAQISAQCSLKNDSGLLGSQQEHTAWSDLLFCELAYKTPYLFRPLGLFKLKKPLYMSTHFECHQKIKSILFELGLGAQLSNDFYDSTWYFSAGIIRKGNSKEVGNNMNWRGMNGGSNLDCNDSAWAIPFALEFNFRDSDPSRRLFNRLKFDFTPIWISNKQTKRRSLLIGLSDTHYFTICKGHTLVTRCNLSKNIPFEGDTGNFSNICGVINPYKKNNLAHYYPFRVKEGDAYFYEWVIGCNIDWQYDIPKQYQILDPLLSEIKIIPYLDGAFIPNERYKLHEKENTNGNNIRFCMGIGISTMVTLPLIQRFEFGFGFSTDFSDSFNKVNWTPPTSNIHFFMKL